MPKAKAAPNQLGFDFAVPAPPDCIGDLAGLERFVCETVGVVIASDGRARELIAADMSLLLDEVITRPMLDAYSSPARTEHKVPLSRFFALLVVTGRQDLLDPIVRKIGAALLVGEEVKTARLGHLRQRIRELQTEERALLGDAPTMRGRAKK